MVFDQVQIDAEMIARTRQHHSPNLSSGCVGEKVDKFLNGRNIKRVSLAQTVKCNNPNAVFLWLDYEILKA